MFNAAAAVNGDRHASSFSSVSCSGQIDAFPPTGPPTALNLPRKSPSRESTHGTGLHNGKWPFSVRARQLCARTIVPPVHDAECVRSNESQNLNCYHFRNFRLWSHERVIIIVNCKRMCRLCDAALSGVV